MGGRGSSGGGGGGGGEASGTPSSVTQALSRISGTEKQKAWATDIIDGYFKNMDLVIKNNSGFLSGMPKAEQKALAKAAKGLKKEEASAFIKMIQSSPITASKIIDKRSGFDYKRTQSKIFRRAGISVITRRFIDEKA